MTPCDKAVSFKVRLSDHCLAAYRIHNNAVAYNATAAIGKDGLGKQFKDYVNLLALVIDNYDASAALWMGGSIPILKYGTAPNTTRRLVKTSEKNGLRILEWAPPAKHR